MGPGLRCSDLAFRSGQRTFFGDPNTYWPRAGEESLTCVNVIEALPHIQSGGLVVVARGFPPKSMDILFQQFLIVAVVLALVMETTPWHCICPIQRGWSTRPQLVITGTSAVITEKAAPAFYNLKMRADCRGSRSLALRADRESPDKRGTTS